THAGTTQQGRSPCRPQEEPVPSAPPGHSRPAPSTPPTGAASRRRPLRTPVHRPEGSTMISRRRTLSLLAAAGAVPALTSLAGCGPNTSRGGEGDGALRIYWWGGDLRNGLTREALELFSDAHEDIEVSPEYSEWTGYWDKLATQFAGGDAPDVLQLDEAYIVSYGSQSSLLDLGAVSGVVGLSVIDAALLDTGRLADGTLVGAPLGIGIFSVGVDAAPLEQAALVMPDGTTWTWEDFAQLSDPVSEWAR